MLLILLVLVTVQREHDGLKQIVDLAHLDQLGQRCDVARVVLQQMEQLTIVLTLRLVLDLDCPVLHLEDIARRLHDLVQGDTVLDEQRNLLVQVPNVSLQCKVLLARD
ncbi:hypothetical protein SAMD00019534_038580 [Acytostelium subglobosum LB1]|uniref:hypothetical protein n=1 Tax=Acytostelium subglobosum LB1 TaxID=1410327 RepID=UPI0006448B2F|nr:hypothetical protein SAMD00019534_038580 [Acytostelium subglobosum LB1]GAM20683.1 hypothetical protein SAMD00019534_038580 [Acytostelium subglobosum LB1]|eukprot:XP_012760204.1 hypothetical protein SAMD00019534_038580 [Acytostelium subglobosum LB1]